MNVSAAANSDGGDEHVDRSMPAFFIALGGGISGVMEAISEISIAPAKTSPMNKLDHPETSFNAVGIQ